MAEEAKANAAERKECQEVTVTFQEATLGLDLESDEQGRNALVCGFKGDNGEAERSGLIKIGMILISLNDLPLAGLSFDEIVDNISGSEPPRTIVFAEPSGEDSAALAKAKFPFPENYFGTGPGGITLTEEEKEAVKADLEGRKAEFLRCSNATEADGWKLVRTKNGVSIYQGKLEGSEVHFIRGSCRIPMNAHDLLVQMQADGTAEFRALFHKVDVMFQDGLTVHRFDEQYQKLDAAGRLNLPFHSIKWAAFNVPWPLWSRDFLWAELSDILEDGTAISFGCSVERPEVPDMEKSHKLVRGEIGASGYVFKDVEGEEGGEGACDAHYLVQLDPKGNIPTWAVNLTAADQAMNIGRVRDVMVDQIRAQKCFASAVFSPVDPVFTLAVKARSSASVDVAVAVAGSTVQYEFFTTQQSIDFSVQLPAPTTDAAPPRPDGLAADSHGSDAVRCESQLTPVSGTVWVPAAGTVQLVFGNSFSWFKGKSVTYRVRAVPPPAADADEAKAEGE